MALLFLVIGLMLLFDARNAEIHHTIMSRWPRSAWMAPWQGYVGAVGFFAVSAYAFVLAYRSRG
jgi:hypothetical protein